jgi:hypothetical protein
MQKTLIRHQQTMFALRHFSAATRGMHNNQENYIRTEYLLNTSRVLLRMPQTGQMWFFVDKAMNVQSFKEMVAKQDTQIDNIEVRGSVADPVSDESNIYELLTSRKPLFLTLNGI